jgi:hypothetical protein
MEFSPEQFQHLRGTDPGVRGKSVAAVADTLYNREPEHMAALESHVRENGFQTPVGIRHNPKTNTFGIESGHHRAAVAHRLGVSMPVVDLDEVPHDEGLKSTRARHESWGYQASDTELRARHNMGERGDKGYKTRMKLCRSRSTQTWRTAWVPSPGHP